MPTDNIHVDLQDKATSCHVTSFKSTSQTGYFVPPIRW